MKIKHLTFDKNAIFLSPMAGVGDFAFRALAREFGADFSFTEMISVRGLIFDNEKTLKMLKTLPQEEFAGVQLFGSNPQDFAKAVRHPALEKFAIIDINFGCPVHKLFKNNEGSALMKDPQLIYEIVKATVENTNKPVTAKIRLGINEQAFNGVQVAQLIEKAGASAIFVHGRFRDQQYSGKVLYDYIKQIKQAVSIPVIGNGDIVDENTLNKMRETGVDAVSVARASMGQPWIFAKLKNKNVDINPYDIFHRYVVLLREDFSEKFLSKYLRKHALWYLKNMQCTELKIKVAKAESTSQLLSDMKAYFKP